MADYTICSFCGVTDIFAQKSRGKYKKILRISDWNNHRIVSSHWHGHLAIRGCIISR